MSALPIEPPPPTLGQTAKQMNKNIGVGFWNQRDGEAYARILSRRTGKPHEAVKEDTPHHTHALWFARRKESA